MVKKLTTFTLIGVGLWLAACDPNESYQQCREWGDNQHRCVIYTIGRPFVPN